MEELLEKIKDTEAELKKTKDKLAKLEEAKRDDTETYHKQQDYLIKLQEKENLLLAQVKGKCEISPPASLIP